MKKTYIFGILIIAIAILVIISAAGDASTYVSFKEASDLAQSGNDRKIHVVGKLPKDEKGQIVGLSENIDKLSFTFLLEDNNLQKETVTYNEPIPADFKRSEQIVIIGCYRNGKFVADKILMKCPSKYQENKLVVES